jgi:hypothetical protein
MLLTNQRLDKLAAMRTDFAARGMIPAGHAAVRGISNVLNPHHDDGTESDEEGPSEEKDVLGHVDLAQRRRKSLC